MSKIETKTIQLKIVSPVAKKFIDTLVQKVTEEGWTYNYDKVFTNPFKVFLTKEVYVDSEEPDLTVETGDFRKAGVVEKAKIATCNKQLLAGVASLYDPETLALVIGDAVITGFSPEDTPQSILPVPDEPVSNLVEEAGATVTRAGDTEPEHSVEVVEDAAPEYGLSLADAITTLSNIDGTLDVTVKVGDGNVYTLEQLKPIQWHKLTKIGSAYGLHAMKRGDMEAAIVELSQGNKVNEE